MRVSIVILKMFTSIISHTEQSFNFACHETSNVCPLSNTYHGVAMVTTRRAHEGFTLKYNPDVHRSAAFY